MYSGTVYYREMVCARVRFAAAVLFGAGSVCAQSTAPPAVVAGVPVNYDESLAGNYTLPDPLVLAGGKRVASSKMWMDRRRPELVRLFERHQFGKAPGRPREMRFDVFDKGTPVFDGKAIRRQITVHFTAKPDGPRMDLLLYVPAAAAKKVPVLLNLAFSANSLTVDDPGIKPGEIWNREKKRVPASQGRRFGSLNAMRWIERGIGVATVYYGDIEPDFDGGSVHGIRGAIPGDWGAIAAWAWGLSRALDYLETDAAVDARRVAIVGVSRLGKTVLWAGARDTRFAAAIASCSGEGGASLSRRDYGEKIKHLALRYGYQFTPDYANWGDRVNEFPVDSHLLVALMAPRPLLLQTGDTDRWSDPKGEFLAAAAAAPVYKLLGKSGLGTDSLPAPGQAVGDTLRYYMHAGGHGTQPADWDVFLQFFEAHLGSAK